MKSELIHGTVFQKEVLCGGKEIKVATVPSTTWNNITCVKCKELARDYILIWHVMPCKIESKK